MSKFFDETMEGLLEAVAMEYQKKEEVKKPIEDILTVSYEEGYNGDISLLMVSRINREDGSMKILKLFKEDEADELYKNLIGN